MKSIVCKYVCYTTKWYVCIFLNRVCYFPINLVHFCINVMFVKCFCKCYINMLSLHVDKWNSELVQVFCHYFYLLISCELTWIWYIYIYMKYKLWLHCYLHTSLKPYRSYWWRAYRQLEPSEQNSGKCWNFHSFPRTKPFCHECHQSIPKWFGAPIYSYIMNLTGNYGCVCHD